MTAHAGSIARAAYPLVDTPAWALVVAGAKWCFLGDFLPGARVAAMITALSAASLAQSEGREQFTVPCRLPGCCSPWRSGSR